MHRPPLHALSRYGQREPKAIQSTRAEYDLRTAFSEQERSGLAYTATCARDYDDLAFGS